MNIVELHQDILTIKSDALIYSTNTRLSLSGGVGAALVKKYGQGIQTELINQSAGFGFEIADLGDVYEAKTENMPWVKVFHAICLDGTYIVSEEIVRKILTKTFKKCDENKEIKTVSVSALGTGYGSFTYSEFKKVLGEVLVSLNPKSITEVFLCNLGEKKI